MATIPYRRQHDRLLSRSNELCSDQLRLLRRGQRHIRQPCQHHLRWIHMHGGGVLHRSTGCDVSQSDPDQRERTGTRERGGRLRVRRTHHTAGVRVRRARSVPDHYWRRRLRICWQLGNTWMLHLPSLEWPRKLILWQRILRHKPGTNPVAGPVQTYPNNTRLYAMPTGSQSISLHVQRRTRLRRHVVGVYCGMRDRCQPHLDAGCSSSIWRHSVSRRPRLCGWRRPVRASYLRRHER